MDANHCPGAVQLIFKLRDGRRFLHCGDMRFSEAMLRNPHVAACRQAQTTVFLDTTYCNPRYTFPQQASAVQAGCQGQGPTCHVARQDQGVPPAFRSG